MSATTVLIALSTAPDESVAATIARALVEEGLAACVNRIAGARSVYRWQGGIEDEAEVLLLIKTTTARFAELRRRLGELHPYELPELIAVEAAAGSAAYLDWVRSACAPERAG